MLDMLALDKTERDKGKKGKKTGRKTTVLRWQRRMKLTPCIVMTCYMLPEKMVVKQHAGQKKFDDDYLYDFADLLIVDEAGQVLPEVAAASFALAKKALVIGDTEQIAPIWGVSTHIDIGNMQSEKILTAGTQEEVLEQYEHITQLGKTAAAGNVMKIGQSASRYHYDRDLARGMYLYEHRRCLNKIINYCNSLCYHGKLIPQRGNEGNNLYPAMGYLHIDGKAILTKSGSHCNLLEAETIAAWIVANRHQIESHYKKSLHEIIGVLTPFNAQVFTIKQAFKKHGIHVKNEAEITVGTVHSLQGAEREIIIFSSVYSKHRDGGFIDRDNSMLNVAVSRAKDNFLVFGDMDLFDLSPDSTPRGLLKKYLFYDENNALQFEYKQRSDLETPETQIYALHGVEQHDDFLAKTFKLVTKNITIVSPWLTWQKLDQTGFLDEMSQACDRGVEVVVITDKALNTGHANIETRKEKQKNLENLLAHLNSRGISTKLVDRVHSKIVIGDSTLLCVGSFNWFSASREDQYKRYDTSLVYHGESLHNEIKTIQNNLARRVV